MANKQDFIEGLQISIRKLHGCESQHVESVPIKEDFQGKTIWEGVVEVFKVDHTKAKRCFAWIWPDDKDGKKDKFIAVLELPPVDSPSKAVQAAIASEIKQSMKQ